MSDRPQVRHGCNRDGAARSPLGEIVWFLDLSERHEPRHERTEREELELARRRAALTNANAPKDANPQLLARGAEQAKR